MFLGIIAKISSNVQMEKIKNYLPRVIKYLLLTIALTPIVYTGQKTLYPFIFGKVIFFRSLVEIALILSLIYLIIRLFSSGDREFKIGTSFFKNRLFALFALFTISGVLSTIFAVDKYTAFWGTLERGGGLLGFLHFFIFLCLTAVFFQKKDFLPFFKISLIIGFVVILYGLFQYFDLKEFPFSLEQTNRPGSFIGNPSFLSAYLFFIIASAVLVFSLTKNLFWRIFSFFLILSSVTMIFFSATRGAILGLAVGTIILLIYYVFFSKTQNKKRFLPPSLLILLTLLLSVFWLTRFNPFWREIPGFNRFAGMTSLVPKDGSVQTRLVTWQISWEAFKEKPIFGWGPDNYLVAWNKHYDFKLASYGETWLDRAHNQLLDVLVMQGIIGLLIYFALFGFIFYKLFIKKTLGSSSPFLGAVLLAYFVQNTFLFDEISSYFLFIALVSFLIANTRRDEEKSNVQNEKVFRVSKNIIIGGSGVLALSTLFALYFYNYIPYAQGKNIQLARGGQKDFVRAQLIKSFHPYNFAQSSIRGYVTDFYYADRVYIFENDDFKILRDEILNSIQEIIDKGSLDPRFYIRKHQIFDVLGERDPKFYEKSEEAIRQALKLTPNRAELWYNLSLSLAKQGKFDEAIALSREIRDSNSSVGRTHFLFALLLSVQDLEKNRSEIILALDKTIELDPNLDSLQASDINKIAEIYLKLQEYEKTIGLVMKSVDRTTPKVFEPQHYEFALKYFLFKRNADEFIKIAEFVGAKFPTYRENMDGLADLARKGLWQVLDKLP